MDEKNELDIDLNVHILNLTVVFGWEDTSQTNIPLMSGLIISLGSRIFQVLSC